MTSKMKKLISASFAVLLVFALSANFAVGQGGGQSQVQGETVVDKVSENSDTSDFSDLLEQSGFAQVLAQQGPYTVLAPSNDALAKGEVDVESAKENQKQAQQVVQNHLYQGEISADEVESSMGVKVQKEDESPANGVVYVVDKVVTR
ncbi:fasciclin domain-containing protein [Fodinibius sp. Rm-B-1B1-1]|uniref:fasciclin domain-containing protein n=1 Tax=Fodinibius alkaliphilus TaxID=3140241 RepID=UPI00315A0258